MSSSRGCVPLGTHKVLWCLSTNPIFAATPRNVQGETVTSILQIKKPGLSRTGSKVQKGRFRFPNPSEVLFHTLRWADAAQEVCLSSTRVTAVEGHPAPG